MIQEPSCYLNEEHNVIALPSRQGRWQQFLPTEYRNEHYPIRTLIYANQWTNARQIPIASPDITAIEITIGDRKVMAVSIYIPGIKRGIAEAERTIQYMLTLISNAKRIRPNHELIVAGDFNRHDPL
jgi:Endonuclease-reverse transcriptase